MPAELGEEGDGDRSDPARGARDRDRPLHRRKAMPLERQHAEHRRIAGRADRHRMGKAQALGEPHQPVALDASIPCIASEMRLPEPKAVQDDSVILPPILVARLLDEAGKIDAGDHRKAAHHRRSAGQRQPILVVDGRMRHPHQDVAFHQGIGAEALEGDALPCIGLLDEDRVENHSALPAMGCGATS